MELPHVPTLDKGLFVQESVRLAKHPKKSILPLLEESEVLPEWEGGMKGVRLHQLAKR